MHLQFFLLLQLAYCLNVKALFVGSMLRTNPTHAFQPSQPLTKAEMAVPSFARSRMPVTSRLHVTSPNYLSSLGESTEKSVIHAIPAPIEQNLMKTAERDGYEPVRSARGAPTDVIAEFNPYTPRQRVGSCHMFAVAQVLYSTIKRHTGREISIGTMFADHLLSPFNHYIGPAKILQSVKDHALEVHYGSIEKLKAEKATCDSGSYEGGNFHIDIALLQAFGAALVRNSADYKFVEDAAMGLSASRLRLIQTKDQPDPLAKAVLENSIDRILSKSVHVLFILI